MTTNPGMFIDQNTSVEGVKYPYNDCANGRIMNAGTKRTRGKQIEPDANSIGGRLRWVLKTKGLKQIDLARAIGVSANAVSAVVKGDSKMPSAENLLRICAYLKLNPDWFIKGRGDPFQDPDSDDKGAEEIIEIYKTLDGGAQAALLALIRSLSFFLTKK